MKSWEILNVTMEVLRKNVLKLVIYAILKTLNMNKIQQKFIKKIVVKRLLFTYKLIQEMLKENLMLLNLANNVV